MTERARGFWRLWVGTGLVALAVGLVGAGCGGSGVSSGSGPGPGPGDPTPPDVPANQSISVDGFGISGAVEGQTLQVAIPVQATSGDAKGELRVWVVPVGEAHAGAAVNVAFDLKAGERGTLFGSVALPEAVPAQADLVRFNLLVLGEAPLRVTRSLLHVVPPFDVRLEGPARVAKGTSAFYRVRVESPGARAPVAGAAVQLVVKRGGEVIHTASALTAPTGDAHFELELGDEGDVEVMAMGSAEGAEAAADAPVKVEGAERRVLLTTDKPLYQPGQTIHLRALALERPALGPASGEVVVFEVEDGKGNKILKKDTETDEYGIAATTFDIGPHVNMGTFAVRAIVGDHEAQKTVEVSRYALPKFRADIVVERPWYRPGETVEGQIEAGYFFGQPVAGGQVELEAFTVDIGESVFRKVVGTTDAKGKLAFSLQLPDTLVGLPLQQGRAVVGLRAQVTDTADQVVVREKSLIVSPRAVELTIVPEAGAMVPGIDNRLLVFATDPLGGPLAGEAITLGVQVGSATQTVTLTTDTFGQAEVATTLPDSVGSVQVQGAATGPRGSGEQQTFSFSVQSGGAHLLVRTDRAVYGVGDELDVDILVSAGVQTVYVDWVSGGQVVDMRTLSPIGGVASFSAGLDSGRMGSNRIEAYVIDSEGRIARAGRTFFVRSESALTVSLSTDKPLYAPGEEATLTFSVTDEQGQPASAALGVQIVDEAVFALIDARPGLLRTTFELDDAFAEPAYQIGAPAASIPDLLYGATASADALEADAAQRKAEGVMAALAGTSLTGVQAGSWSGTLVQAKGLLQEPWAARKQALLASVKAEADAVAAELGAEGCTPDSSWCEGMSGSFGDALKERLAGRVGAVDLWGSPMEALTSMSHDVAARLRSLGPDELPDTGDEHTLEYKFSDLGFDSNRWSGWWGEPGGEGGWDDNLDGGAPSPTDPTGPGEPDEGEGGPRVRRDFPETLYVNPALIAGGDGKATVTIPMADSITEWRVSTLAHSKSGQLGGGQAGVTVFQDFFVDINFPATLTRGDEITFPIALYNYLDVPQTVALTLKPGDWYTALGDTQATVELAAGQVAGLGFPVRVEDVGLHTLTVVGIGSELSDAVARTVRVVPDGKQVPGAASGSLAPGEVTLPVAFPDHAVPGSQVLYLNVYPGFLSQVVEGMDSMLQVPTGCFEQTTATTWPNVLIMDYMKETGIITPEIQLKAEGLISAGYQRLLTFEHPGGGFSWFGTSDPGPFLSVTAFGLMEFVDMSQVWEVDPVMIERTRQWILTQQQGDGSWPGDISEFFTFHTSGVRNTAFVLWALSTAGTTGSPVQLGVQYVKQHLYDETPDAYTLALVANALALAAPTDPIVGEILAELDAMKETDDEGRVWWTSGGTQTPFYESGNSSAISATALATLAYLQAGAYPANVSGALDWLLGQKDSLGNWNSTQATIWTLRALLVAAKAGTEGATGVLGVSVDGVPVQELLLTPDQWDVMTTVDLTPFAYTGERDVTLTFAGEGKVSYNLVSSYHVPWVDAPGEGTGVLSLTVAYDKTELAVNDTAEVTLAVTNNTAATYNMVLVDVGIPPGFEVITEDLQPYVDASTTGDLTLGAALSKFETTARQLTLYISELPGSATFTYVYRVRATMPVKASDGGAVAYLYYDTEERTSSPATTVEASDTHRR